MSRNTRTFSDLDLNFTAHPVNKDIVRRLDENAIHSEIGSPIRALLFELPGPMFTVMMKRAIVDVINNFEPRVNIIDVLVNDSLDENAVYITLNFKIVNTQRPISLDLALERTR